MRLLVLGGTKFLGRALTEAALSGGHEVTLFNRGQTNPGLFPEAEHLHGDLDGDLSALAGREWDAVVDVPGWFAAPIEALRGSVGHYTFVSSISVYADLSQPVEEETATYELEPGAEKSEETYGAYKAHFEQAVRDAYPNALIVRPGLIVGPHDPSGRFTYWALRSDRPGPVLAPGDGEQPVQVIDARDLGAWILSAVERRLTGTFNATGPVEPLPIREVVATALPGEELVWVDSEFLLEREVGPWLELPLWLPGDEYAGMLNADISRALAEGLSFRPLAETVADTRADRPAQPDGVGLTPDREAELLAEWRGR